MRTSSEVPTMFLPGSDEGAIRGEQMKFLLEHGYSAMARRARVKQLDILLADVMSMLSPKDEIIGNPDRALRRLDKIRARFEAL